MAVSPNFRDYVADQLSALRGLVMTRMFGGLGLYVDGKIFGLIDDDIVYLRVDDASRPEYEKRGLEPFRPVRSDPKKVSLNYYQVPGDILDDSEALLRWAERAVVATRAKTAGALRKERKKPVQQKQAKKSAKPRKR
jgi:DNA transformation protein and related proteins